jgi:hypothetical protein
MRAAWLAVGVVLVANAIAIVPAERERANPVGEFTLAVCRDQVVGGWNDAQLTTLRLPLDPRPGTLGTLADSAALVALGFPASAYVMVGDTSRADTPWPMPRMAWLALRQQPDSFRSLEVVRVAPTREALAPVAGELAMRGLVGFEWQWDDAHLRPDADSATRALGSRRPRTIGIGVVRLIPAELGLERDVAARLLTLRDDAAGMCPRTVDVRLLMGRDGAVWVHPAP